MKQVACNIWQWTPGKDYADSNLAMRVPVEQALKILARESKSMMLYMFVPTDEIMNNRPISEKKLVRGYV